MPGHKNIARLADVPIEPIKGPEESSFGGMRQRVGAAVGAKKLGYSVFVVPPGKTAFPCHAHYTNEEMIYIFDGEGTLRIGKNQTPVSAGMFVAFTPGIDYAHQLINTSNRDLRYLCVSTMEYPEVAEYPDSNKVGAYVAGALEGGFRALYKKDASVSYYDGETSGEIERIKKSFK